MVKNSLANADDMGLIPGLGRSPGEGNDNPFQYCFLEYAMDREAWRAAAYGVARVIHDLVTKPPPPPPRKDPWLKVPNSGIKLFMTLSL